MRADRRLLLTCLLLAACGGKGNGGGPDAGAADAGAATDAPICPTAHELVYHGTSAPSYVPLTPGQILAIGSMVPNDGTGNIYCSGTLITPRWVLTANHCGVATTDLFCAGEDSTKATCVKIKSVHSQPYAGLGGTPGLLDLTLVELADDATVKIPGIEPIPLWQGDEAPLLNKTVEIAGYGSTEAMTYNIRYFAVETIDAVGPANDGAQWLRVNAGGVRGPCDGDSGGPAMVIDEHCAVRVVGALTWGDNPYGTAACPGQDRYTRTDLAMTWIASLVGSTDGTCGAIDAIGECNGTTATYCDGGALKRDDCSASACGWNGTGYRCIAGADPCQGIGEAGTCVGDVVHTCTNGTLATKDCAADGGKKCYFDLDQHVVACDADPCQGYDYGGACMGNTLYYCDLGQLQVIDCGATGCGPAQGGGFDCK